MGSHARTPRHGRAPARTADAAFFERHGYCRVPRLVQWMATSRCPLACPHCLAAEDGAGGREMPLAHAARLIEQVAALGVDEFLLTGGEPLVREDLPSILAALRANGVRWSLNTAAMPGPAVRRAMEEWPPAFVAVSLDGPEEVHDRFRGREGAFEDALASLAYFADLAPDGVAAGTTATSRNLAHLGETLGIVVDSGASQWGLHLVVPEGRAARRPDLFLSRAQLRRLLRFAAAKRHYFPVTMADEIGHCGPWEPLVRDEPFFCGAGKAQCVVLPDGEVVPCTTTDRSASAGNVLRTPLDTIWANGFGELRSWRPRGKCARCGYAAGCEGGCWLQRRHGTQCFRDAWGMPRALARAGLAVGLGLAAGLGGASGEAAPWRPLAAARPTPEQERMEVLQRSIIQWYAAMAGGRRTPTVDTIRVSVQSALPDDPGARYFLAFVAGGRPEAIEARARQIEAALETTQRSLCLIGLGWRDVAEWCLDGLPPQQRGHEDREALRRVLGRLGATAEAWRAEILKHKLDASLRLPGAYRRFFRSKAGPPAWVRIEDRLAAKRGWNRPAAASVGSPTTLACPHGATMTLTFQASDAAMLRCVRGGKEVPLDGQFRVFDILVVPDRGDAVPAKLAFPLAHGSLEVTLPAAAELTYADILRLAWEQNREPLERLADQASRSGPPAPGAPFLLPVLRARLRALEALAEPAASSLRYRIGWQLADLYLF
jgi:radical SAM protein with 4Fe4S-binding SPASM domain